MRVTKIGLSRSVKLSINYQSIQASVSLEAEVEDNESPDQVKSQLSEIIDRILREEIEKQTTLLTTYTGGTR